MIIFSSIFGFGIGWGKPCPVNPYNLRPGPKTGMALVAAAGPVSNLVVATFIASLLQLPIGLSGSVDDLLGVLVIVNVSLAFFNLIPVLNALENAALPMILDGMRPAEARKRAQEWLEQVGLSHRLSHRPSELSGGEQQRVAIARALASDPTLILADEPTGSLDQESAEAVFDLLKRFYEHGATVIIATHDTELIRNTGGRVIILKQGCIETDTKIPKLT